MGTINDRIQIIVDKMYAGNISLLSRDCDISAQTLASILGDRKSKPNSDTLEKLYNAVASKGISASWLLAGEGEMKIAENVAVRHKGSRPGCDPIDDSPTLTTEVEYLREICRLKDEIIRLQQEVKVLSVENAEIKVGFTGNGNGSAPNASAKTA